MAVYNWGVDFTIVAGADISGQQYKNVNLSGVLATSADNVFGVVQGKTGLGEHATVRKIGYTKMYLPISLGVGARVMQSNATSGVIALVTSGYGAFAEIVITANSGGYGTAYLFGGPLFKPVV